MKKNLSNKNKKQSITFDFAYFTKIISDFVGNFWCFIAALSFVLIWGLSGPVFGFSDTWQLIINTATTIITFLMVFLIQHTQNRDIEILNLKLDELIKVNKKAKNSSIDLEKLSDSELKSLEKEYKKICSKNN